MALIGSASFAPSLELMEEANAANDGVGSAKLTGAAAAADPENK